MPLLPVSFIHKLAHKFGFYFGTVESFVVGNYVVIGFECSKCHRLSGCCVGSFLGDRDA